MTSINDFFQDPYESEEERDLYHEISNWVWSNPKETFFLIAAQQNNADFEVFCRAVLFHDKTPVIITNVSNPNKPYSLQIRNAMRLSDKVRVYEVAKMAMTVVLRARARLFVEINGGLIWTP